ncbi:hypothetical protein B0J17DRAFT_709969 [Rhizoctonia solani]|nr:hypothetical protein B0J17DRAFT_709969 [Rhizoctonia solani]
MFPCFRLSAIYPICVEKIVTRRDLWKSDHGEPVHDETRVLGASAKRSLFGGDGRSGLLWTRALTPGHLCSSSGKMKQRKSVKSMVSEPLHDIILYEAQPVSVPVWFHNRKIVQTRTLRPSKRKANFNSVDSLGFTAPNIKPLLVAAAERAWKRYSLPKFKNTRGRGVVGLDREVEFGLARTAFRVAGDVIKSFGATNNRFV